MTYQTYDVLQMAEHYKELNQELKEDLSVLEKEERRLRARTTIFQEIAQEKEIVEAIQEEFAHYERELAIVEQHIKEKEQAYETNEVIIGKLKQLL